ncbi:hypothetical protein [Nocardioides sp. SYSU DS0663]|uniref:hypothetical protein n=1 Tax=Nocardioides sp. SYSU DS0663 TaxID=3416445 RepID=UPI003F4AFDF6
MKLFRTALLLPLVTALVLAVLAPPAHARALRPTPDRSVSFDGAVEAMAVRGSTVYVAGIFRHALRGSEKVARRHVAAVDARTGRLLPWRVRVNGPVHTVAVSRGHVYLGGEFTRVGRRAVAGVARVSAETGKVDRRFRPRVSGAVHAFAFVKHRVFLGGEFNAVNGQHRTRLAAVTRKGALKAWSPRADNTVQVLRARDGRVYAGGLFGAINGNDAHGYLVALSKRTGGVVRAFDAELPVPALDFRFAGRRLVVAGGGRGGRLTVLGGNGAHRWTTTFDGDAAAVQVFDRRIYVGGHWEYLCSSNRVAESNGDCLDGKVHRPRLAAFRMNGERTQWAPHPDSVEGVWALGSSAGRLVVGGNFDHFRDGAVTQRKLAFFSRG